MSCNEIYLTMLHMQFSLLCKGPILDVFVVFFHTNPSLGYLIRIL